MSIAISGVSCGKSKLISPPIWIRIVVLTGLPDHHPAKARAVAALQKRSSHGPARFTSELGTVDLSRLAPAPDYASCGRAFLLVHFACHKWRKRIMAKGAMKAGKEA
ncbi:hypothetical protein, partial [Mesorhizobium sp.]|uniref:hypothetical protein n=1 Tax=Mesorhizobium sp. TaxID=1871066 RepID=UPI002580BDF5